MLVISDTSALSALAESRLMDALPAVFPAVVITESVRRECSHPGAPAPLQDWVRNLPSWITVTADPAVFLPETFGLGAGEASSLSLAWENRPLSTVILDDREGRDLAQALGLNYIGLLGVVDFRMSEAAIAICRVRSQQ